MVFLSFDSRLKKEHEVVRQETVQVILGEQKLQVEHRLLKNELDELSKVRGQGHFMLESFGDWYCTSTKLEDHDMIILTYS